MSDRTHHGPTPPATDPDSVTVPLVVDLDGTLTRTDLLVESLFRLLALDPFALLRLPLWLTKGKAALKARIADEVTLDLHELPMNDELVEYIRDERARGRKIYLASASDRRYVERLAEHLGLFDGAFGSDGATNLSGAEKARVLCEVFGERGFDYAANSSADMEVWAKARRAILVNVPASLSSQARRVCADVHELTPPPPPRERWRAYGRAMRAHQWLKNLLVFLPALAAHAFDRDTLANAALAFLAFSLCASSVYLLNDLIDLPSDRAHPTKKARPFASGQVDPARGVLLIPLLLLASAVVATTLPGAFGAVLALYYATTLLYTLVLKRRIVIDVLTLAGLYTLRLIAGTAATGIEASEWLLAFSMFVFLCLALIKRYSELMEKRRTHRTKLAGRGYVTDDTPMVGALAGASGFVSVLVLALYINSPDVHELYPRPDALWAIGILLLYWVSRILMLAHRGEVHDDPVVFAVKDRGSLVVVALMALAVVMGSLP